jgi:hypothetical protein
LHIGNLATANLSRELIMTLEHFQNLVIGSGVGGKIIAWTLAENVTVLRPEPLEWRGSIASEVDTSRARAAEQLAARG